MLPALAKEPCGPQASSGGRRGPEDGEPPPAPHSGELVHIGFRKWLRPTALFNNNLLGSLHGRLDRRCRKITNPLIPRKLERREGLGCTRGSDKRATLSQSKENRGAGATGAKSGSATWTSRPRPGKKELCMDGLREAVTDPRETFRSYFLLPRYNTRPRKPGRVCVCVRAHARVCTHVSLPGDT